VKTFLTALLCILPIAIFAGEIPVKINDSITVSRSVVPDTMESTVTVYAKTETFEQASALMEQTASVVKAHSPITTYNSYNVSPMYKYDNNQRILTGFSGQMRIPALFSDMPLYNAFLSDLNQLSGVTLSMSGIVWTVSKETIKSVKAELKNSIVKQIYSLLPTYTGLTDMRCSVSVISFDGASIPVTSPVLMRSSAKLEMSAPDANQQDISVSATYKLICK
jgi:uncharacterized protein YggE